MRLVLCLVMAAVWPLAAEKQLRPGESEIYNEVIKDLTASSLPGALTDLDAWRQKFPDSDFKDDRAALYVQTYVLSNQFDKALDAAEPLLAKDLNATFAGAQGPLTTVRLLYNVVAAISQLPNPSPAEIVTATKAAQQLVEFDRPLPGVDPGKWAEARADMRAKASGALLYMEILPGIQAMAKTPPDCHMAEEVYRRALAEYPARAALSYELGRALNCEARANPEKQAPAIYEFVRAATLDPTLGDPRNDRKKIEAFANNAYIRIHGSDEGLSKLREQVRESPLPPPDFTIKTADQIAQDRDEAFAREHPQSALWKNIRALLTADDGQQYFESQMKDAALPQLTGTLVEARPSCRPRELVVAMAQPGAPEITLKLEKPLAGKPAFGREFQFEAVAEAFVKSPFMLTMTANPVKLQGLDTTPCASARKQ